MQTANLFVALGGDMGNTVPKYGVTAAEIAVLQAIHGDEAVTGIEPVGEIRVSAREERERLGLVYGGAKDNDNNRIVDLVYPGAAARLFERLEELNLSDEQFKPISRVSARRAPPEATQEPTPSPRKASRSRKAKAAAPVDPLPADEDSGEEEEPDIADLDDTDVLG